MKNLITIGLMSIILLSSCEMRWGSNRDVCISADKSTVSKEESVNISNCGDELPSEYVEPEIDWGDGTVTSGQSGSHAYSDDGIYVVKLILNGDEATDVLDVDESKVIIDITVQ